MFNQSNSKRFQVLVLIEAGTFVISSGGADKGIQRVSITRNTLPQNTILEGKLTKRGFCVMDILCLDSTAVWQLPFESWLESLSLYIDAVNLDPDTVNLDPDTLSETRSSQTTRRDPCETVILYRYPIFQVSEQTLRSVDQFYSEKYALIAYFIPPTPYAFESNVFELAISSTWLETCMYCLHFRATCSILCTFPLQVLDLFFLSLFVVAA